MSFSLEFCAESAADAIELIDAAYAPACIKEFLKQAVAADIGRGIYVKAHGHLHSGAGQDYSVSSATIEVKPITFQKVKKT